MTGPATTFAPVELPGGAVLRPLVITDAPALHLAFLNNREHLRPFDPDRPDSFWTLEGQQNRLAEMLVSAEAGTSLPCGMFDGDRVLGAITLQTIVRGPFCSASLGYWVDGNEVGRGLATTAVAALLPIADEQIGLHRLEASAMTSNLASQRVLLKNGFERFGTATNYLHIAGRWGDSHLYQRILNDRPPAAS